MRKTIFIDESGIADLTDYTYRNFVLTSVTVDNSELETIYGYFSLIKRKYGLTLDEPFHTYDLLENPAKRLSPEQGKLFIRSMVEFIELVPMEITAIFVDKVKFRKIFSVDSDDLRGSRDNKEKRGIIYYLAALKQLQLFTDKLSETGSIGYIHADSRTYQDRDLLEAFLHIKQKLLRGNLNNLYYSEAKRRLVSITFADKEALSNGIQLADFASFIIFAYLQKQISLFDDIKLRTIWRKIKPNIKLIELVKSTGKERVKKYL